MIDLDVQENGACETSNEKKAVSQNDKKTSSKKVHAKKSKVEKMEDLNGEKKKR